MAAIKNTRDTILQQASIRLTTTAVAIARSDSVFLKAKNTTTAAITPGSIVLTATITGFSSPTYSWYYANSTAPETFTLITGATASTYTITNSNFLAHVSTGVSVIYKCKVTQAGWNDAESVTTITYNKQNNDVPVAVLNKTSIVLPTTSADVVNYTDSGSTITVSIGGVNIPYATTGANTFNVSAAVTSGTITIGAASTGTTTISNDTRIYANLSGMAAGSAPASITYTVTARDIDGVATTFALVQTVSKATSGATGAAGAGNYSLNFVTAAYGPDQSTVINTREFDGWDSQAYSVNGYVETAYCSAKSTDVGNYFGFGLNSNPGAGTSFTNIDYAWYAAGTTAAVYENGTQQTSFETYTGSTVFSIFYDGSNVKYYLDGVLKRTVARATGAALYVDIAMYKPGKGLKNIVFGSGGVIGTTGSRSITISEYIWATSTPSVASDTTSRNYQWNDGTISGYTSSWSATPASENRSGYYLYQASVTVTDTSGTASTTSFSWSAATVKAISYNGRGAGWFKTTEAVDQATLDGYTSATLTSKFLSATSLVNPVKDDVFTIVGTAPAIRVVTYDGTAWTTATQFINGNLVVDGTVRSKAITTENLSSISASLGEVTAAKITTTDYSQSFLVGNGSGNILNILSKSNSPTTDPLTSIYSYSFNTNAVSYIEDNGVGNTNNTVSSISPLQASNFSQYLDTDRGGSFILSKSSATVPLSYIKGTHPDAQLRVDSVSSPPNLSNIYGYIQNTTTEYVQSSETGAYIFLEYRGSYALDNGFVYSPDSVGREFYVGHKITGGSLNTNAKIVGISGTGSYNYSISGNNIYFKGKYAGSDTTGSTLKVNQRLVSTASSTGANFTVSGNILTPQSSLYDNIIQTGNMLEFTSRSGTDTGIVVNQLYYLVGVSGNSFSVSLTSGGTAVTLTGTVGGTFTFIKENYITSILSTEKTQYCSTTTGSTNITVENGSAFVVNQYVDSTDSTKGIPANTYITAISGNTLTLNNACTKTQSTILTFNYAVTLNSTPITYTGVAYTCPYIIASKQTTGAAGVYAFTIEHVNTIGGVVYGDGHGLRLRTYDITPSGSIQKIKVGNYLSSYNSINYTTSATTGTGLISSALLSTQYGHALIVGKGTVDTLNVYPIANNTYAIGQLGNGYSVVYSYAFTNPSDSRLKTDIQKSILGLEFINKLNPVSYKWIVGSNIVEEVDDPLAKRQVTPVPGVRTHFGLIAQEVKQALPPDLDFAGWVLEDKNNPDSTQALQYMQLISPMIKAIQELSEKVSVLEAEIKTLK